MLIPSALSFYFSLSSYLDDVQLVNQLDAFLCASLMSLAQKKKPNGSNIKSRERYTYKTKPRTYRVTLYRLPPVKKLSLLGAAYIHTKLSPEPRELYYIGCSQ